MIYLLPFTNTPAQQLTITLDSGTFDFYVRWNERAQNWNMSIGNPATQATLVSNVPLLLGADLLSAYDLGIGYFIVYAEDGVQEDAAFDDLGTRINVYYVSDDLIAELQAAVKAEDGI
jgi:hypothetical protein